MIVPELIGVLVLVALICAVVAPMIWARQVGGSPHDRVLRAKTENQIAKFNAETARLKLEAEKFEAQRTLMSMKTAAEMEALQDRLYQKELEAPKRVKGEVVD